MAIYHLSVRNPTTRSKGAKVVRAAAYISGAKLDDERYAEVHDFTHKRGILHTEIVAPQATPNWMYDRQQLWNAVEAAERRKDSQLSRGFTIALPYELSLEQNIALVREFLVENLVPDGYLADFAIHAPSADPDSDQRNHHAHVMLTTRVITQTGFGKKMRDYDGQQEGHWSNRGREVRDWRIAWEEHANHALEREGHDARIDHRTNKDRGIDREPTKHLGPAASYMERKGRASDRAHKQRQRQTLIDALDHVHDEIDQVDRQIAALERRQKLELETGPSPELSPLTPSSVAPQSRSHRPEERPLESEHKPAQPTPPQPTPPPSDIPPPGVSAQQRYQDLIRKMGFTQKPEEQPASSSGDSPDQEQERLQQQDRERKNREDEDRER